MTDPTRYERLERLAVSLASKFNRIETLAETMALTIASRLSAYLIAPAGRIELVEVDVDLRPLHVLGAGQRPVVTHGRDGRWYFGLRVTYGARNSAAWLTETMVVSLAVESEDATSYSVALAGEPDMFISAVGELDMFFDHIVRSTEDRLTNNFRMRPNFIGFTDTNSNS